jgi:hypothetical protein
MQNLDVTSRFWELVLGGAGASILGVVAGYFVS